MTDRQRTVALLIDYDNLQICYTRDAPGTQLDLGAVMSLAQHYGRVVVARAYAEWNLLSERLAVYKSGIEPAFAPVLRPEGSNREGKSLADTVMVSDGVDLLWTHQPDVLVLVTSDKDMVPLARIAKQRGCLVVVLGSDLTAVQLIEMANEFVTYRHLVKELGRPEEKLAPSRIREEPRLRRAREPVGSPEIAAAREASLRQPRTPPSRARTRPQAVARPASAIVPPPAEPEAPPAVVPELAAGGSAEATPPASDDQAQPLAARRRRRRRRRTPGAEQAGDELGQEVMGSEEQDERVDLEIDLSGSVVERESPDAQPAEESAPDAPAMPGSESNERPSVPTEHAPGAESASPVAAREEPPALKPWERWPETPPPPPTPIRPARSRRAAPASRPAPEPVVGQDGSPAEAGLAPVGATSDADVADSIERASLPAAAVQAEVAAEWSPAAATEPAPAATENGPTAAEDGTAPAEEAKPAPARRTRRRRPTGAKAAVGATATDGE